MTINPDDLALNDANVAQLAWYHTSTQPDWPTRNFDPAATLTELTKQRMGGTDRVARWAERQRAKAMHLGTYEAAVHNMLRRIDDQADYGKQFYLYRVHLEPTVTVRKDWLIEPSNFVGDVVLDEVCPPGIDVTRYLNYHEDPGALSLAVGRTAIYATQQIAIPSLRGADSDWVAATVSELEKVSAVAPPSPDPAGYRTIAIHGPPSPRSLRAHELVDPLVRRLPINLQRQFEAATAFSDALELEVWARYAVGLVNMLLAPATVLAELNEQPVRVL